MRIQPILTVLLAAAAASAQPFQLTAPVGGSLVTAGQPVTLTWTGGTPTNNLAIVLIDIATFSVWDGWGLFPNTGSQAITINPTGRCGRASRTWSSW